MSFTMSLGRFKSDFTRQSCLLCHCKKYATSAPTPSQDNNDTSKQNVDHHGKHELHPWPRSKKPSPYEIFQISLPAQRADDKNYNQQLKKMYQKYVKIYHPDIASNINITDGAKELSSQQKRDRFDQVQQAYDLLQDPQRRRALQTYQQTRWSNYNREQHRTNTFNTYRMANAHRRKYAFDKDEAFWRAGTWEDYYKMRYNRTPPTQEEFDRNKYKILMGVLLVASITTGLQIMLAIDKANDFNRETALMNMRALKDMDDSYGNYDQGTTRLQRLRRFLLWRRSAMLDRDSQQQLDEHDSLPAVEPELKFDQAKLDDMKLEEERMMRRFAQQKLSQQGWYDDK